MNRLEKKTSSLPNDSDALYQELFIDGSAFQETLKKKYPHRFTEGRFRETFVPVFNTLSSGQTNSNSQETISGKTRTTEILPIYGCQDGCCEYIFVRVELAADSVRWTAVGQNMDFVRASDMKGQSIGWLEPFDTLEFQRLAYELIFD